MAPLLVNAGFFYLCAFLLLAFMPGWITLFCSTAVAAILLGWAFNEVMKSSGGLVAFVGLILLGALSLGFLSGFLARALVLVGRWRAWRIRPAIVLPGMLIAAPPAAALLAFHNLW